MARELAVARELAPAGLRSGPKILGALRTPARAISLATSSPSPQQAHSYMFLAPFLGHLKSALITELSCKFPLSNNTSPSRRPLL